MACVQIEFEIPPELQIGDSDSDATQRASILGLTCCMGHVERGLPGVASKFGCGAGR